MNDQPNKPQELDACIASYSRKLAELLSEQNRSATLARKRRGRDPELQKILARLYGAMDELLRLPARNDGDRPMRIRLLLETEPLQLTLDLAIEVFDAIDRILIELGDARFLCEEIAGELQWAKESTTWMTWGRMFGASVPAAIRTYAEGKPVLGDELEAARDQLGSFRRARSDDYQVHRSRQKLRAQNLRVLTVVLLPLVLVVGLLLVMVDSGTDAALSIALTGVMGALGAAMSGTLKARDKLIRGSDLRAFSVGLVAQLLMGAGAAFFLLLILKSGLLQIAGTNSLEGGAVLGFVAGFSEPFFLRTIERIATLGEEKKAA